MYTFAGKTDENGIWIEDTLFDEETGDYLYSVLKEADGSLSLQTPGAMEQPHGVYRSILEL